MTQGWLIKHRSEFSAIYRILDGLIVSGGLILWVALLGDSLNSDWFLLAFISAFGFSVLAESFEVYRTWRADTFLKMAAYTLAAWCALVAIIFSLIFVTNYDEVFSRWIMALWAFSTPVWLMLLRFVQKSILLFLRRRGYNTRRAVIIGVTESALRLAGNIESELNFGIRLEGFYRSKYDEVDESLIASYGPRYRVLGDVDDALSAAVSGDIDLCFIAIPMRGEAYIVDLLHKLDDTSATVHVVADWFVSKLIHGRFYHVGDSNLLSIYDTPISGITGWAKRLEDLVVSILALAIFMPLMALIALVIKLTSPGPVIFKQARYGLDGRPIDVWKFRTMCVQENGAVITQACKNDSRVTPFGRFLRKTSLDELPQFINVLQGTMSIVGPRPHAVAHNEQYRKCVAGYMLRHKVKPGITGWAQINGWRGETDTIEKMQKRVEYDLQYIRRWSIFLDVRIIFATLLVGFINKHAY